MAKHGKIPTWYDKDSEFEELFRKDTRNEKITNQTIERILKKYKVKTVHDFTCGTGSQVIYLFKKGYKVTGSDISSGMLKIAKRKAKEDTVKIKILRGDMRYFSAGQFDAAITIFNSIGHLTKSGFKKTIRNIYKNLNSGGIYIFDIINLNYVLDKNNIIKMSLEQIATSNDTKIRELQHSTIDNHGILTSYTTFYIQNDLNILKVSKNIITLQLYTATELKNMLTTNGFKVLHQCSIDGSKFDNKKTEHILTIAKKQ